ncbi:MAG: Fic family protein [Tannerellaceae bacterium]|jgi:Fic family protein|nr:Fic family protein [Tannerellaceae bacterium]
MAGKKDVWQTMEQEQKLYNELNLGDMKDYNKFYIYSIIAHSTAIEGSTLSEMDAQLLFDEGITKKGTMIEHLMNLDLKRAYEYAAIEAGRKTEITPDFLKNLNALIMQHTGGPSYMDYKKVPNNVNRLCDELNKRLDAKDLRDTYTLSFDAHFYLVTIHPWRDGNGRACRLLMNYIQFYHGIVPTKVHKEDKDEYIKALAAGQEKESTLPFREFMAKQHVKTLKNEINHFKKGQNKHDTFTLLF